MPTDTPEPASELSVLEALVERAQDAMFAKDLDGRYVFANPAAARAVDLSPAELVGRTDEEVFSASTAAEIREMDQRILREGRPFTYQTVRRDFGEARYFLTTKVPWLDGSGRARGLICVTHDVTSVQAAHQAARSADASFRHLVEATPDLVLVHRDGRLVYANDAAARALGVEAGELVGRRLPADGDALVRDDGHRVPVEAVAVPIAWHGVQATALVARDLSERRALESRLAMTDRLATAGTLAAGVAHEVNNPLTTVLHNLYELAEQLPKVEDPRAPALVRLAREALDGAERIAGIVRGLGVQRHGSERGAGVVDVAAATLRALGLATPQLRARARVVEDIAPATSVGDEGPMVQVALNLLVNAVQAIQAGDMLDNVVRVSVSSEGGWVRMSVEDNGPGVDPAVRGRIFEPFITTKPVGEGTGLGLWVCHSIVQGWGGRIEVEDVPGGGARFTVCLPAKDAPSPASVPAPVHAPGGPRARLLVVEDERSVAEILVKAVERLGDADIAGGLRAARALLGVNDYDAVLCDLHLPDGSAKDLHGELVQQGLGERVLYITGGAVSTEVADFLALVPQRRVIEKPFRVKAVRLALSDLLDGVT